jgi:hypothetical protein
MFHVPQTKGQSARANPIDIGEVLQSLLESRTASLGGGIGDFFRRHN